MPAVRHVNGFYPWPVPVSLTDEAAVFASGGALYRVDARMNARRQDLAGEITQVVQTEQGVRALTWARNGRAELVRLDERLQVLGRRQLLPGGTAPRRGMEDPYDLEDWRNQREFLLLTEEDAVRRLDPRRQERAPHCPVAGAAAAGPGGDGPPQGVPRPV